MYPCTHFAVGDHVEASCENCFFPAVRFCGATRSGSKATPCLSFPGYNVRPRMLAVICTINSFTDKPFAAASFDSASN